MVAQSIDQLKHDWTDKYVVVDAVQPELARFRDIVGQVKTVNMSGRALVEFLDYHLNIGWFDIDLDFLKVVDKPAPKAEKVEGKKAAKPATKAPAAEAASPAAKAKPAAPAKAAGGKQSVADILAAARAGKAAPAGGETASAAAKTAPPAKAATPVADKGAAAKVDRTKMSVADMLAAARAGGASGATLKSPGAKSPSEVAPVVESAADAEAEPEAAPAAKVSKPASSGKLDKSKMSIDDICNWCREHDTK